MTRTEVINKINDYNRLFYEKTKDEEEAYEISKSWYEILEDNMAVYLGINHDDAWNEFFERIEKMLELPSDSLKRQLLKDKALEELIDLKEEIEELASKKCLDNSISLDSIQYNKYKEQMDEIINRVRPFNIEIVDDYKKDILANLEYLITSDIEKASDSVKTFNELIKRRNRSM